MHATYKSIVVPQALLVAREVYTPGVTILGLADSYAGGLGTELTYNFVLVR